MNKIQIFLGRHFLMRKKIFVSLSFIFAVIFIFSGIILADDEIDFDELKARAFGGDTEAQFELGVKYANGDGVEQDYFQAAKWYRRAAEKEHAGAMNDLGYMHLYGKGVAWIAKEHLNISAVQRSLAMR